MLVTHEHGDHSKAMPELMRRGVPLYASQGTWEAMGLQPDYYSGHVVRDEQQLQIGSWVVVPFHVKHDAAEPMGFLFQSVKTRKKGVYIVDSSMVNYNFKDVSHWLIEANYSEDIIENSDYEEWLKNRIRKNHFSLENLLRFFGDSQMDQAEEIWLLHLSDANSDEKQFIDEVQKKTGVPVYC
nr:MBL fold metallo-hydrolase [Balneolaceae bacterium]